LGSLTALKNSAIAECDTDLTRLDGGSDYEQRLHKLKALHHSQCIFNRTPPVPNLKFLFNGTGKLTGEFTCNGYHQGYDGMVHGGVIAAIVDASMTQCLMGNGVVGYTTELSIKYRKPILIRRKANLETSIIEVKRGLLYSMQCEIFQTHTVVVLATGRFYKVK
jgi:acyl-coenzyme A thioesterase PaaI-like protein